jgi:hypothetical protein
MWRETELAAPLLYSVYHKRRTIGEFGYLAKYGKFKEGKVVADHVFPN